MIPKPTINDAADIMINGFSISLGINSAMSAMFNVPVAAYRKPIPRRYMEAPIVPIIRYLKAAIGALSGPIAISP